ncbi:unnamed protein product [Owenia fusiformis]|uniref:Uncharacterized protein n=1 Tax=Owenia fusiformis TaxID=6347 RepID=A0A8J1TG73_OWEFU|nr:unnamed protein product [Owenia fusiformis]
MATTIEDWLKSFQLERYLSLFKDAGITELKQCIHLTEVDIDKLGITLPGHKKRLLMHLPKLSDLSLDLDHILEPPNKGLYSGDFDTTVEDQGIYENVQDTKTTGAIAGDDQGQIYANVEYTGPNTTLGIAPPILPQKTMKKREDINAKLGLGSQKPKIGKAPVPKPRTSKKPSSPVNVDNKDTTNKAVSTPKVPSPDSDQLKPKPKPVPRTRTKTSPTVMHLGGATVTESTDDDPIGLNTSLPTVLSVQNNYTINPLEVTEVKNSSDLKDNGNIHDNLKSKPVPLLLENTINNLLKENSQHIGEKSASHSPPDRQEVFKRLQEIKLPLDPKHSQELHLEGNNNTQADAFGSSKSTDLHSNTSDDDKLYFKTTFDSLNKLSSDDWEKKLSISVPLSKDNLVADSVAAEEETPYEAVWMMKGHKSPHALKPGSQTEQSASIGSKDPLAPFGKTDPFPELMSVEDSVSADTNGNESLSNRPSNLYFSEVNRQQSFNEPPPDFSPPPLPPGFTPQSDVFPDDSSIFPERRPPPSIPPFPEKYHAPQSDFNVKDSDSFDFQNGARETPSPDYSRSSFTDLASNRATYGLETEPKILVPEKLNQREEESIYAYTDGGTLQRNFDPLFATSEQTYEDPPMSKGTPNRQAPTPPGLPPRGQIDIPKTESPSYDVPEDVHPSGSSPIWRLDSVTSSVSEVELSEDSLSDGGEFYSSADFKPKVHVDIIGSPSVDTAPIKAKTGYLYKQGGKQGNKGWRKRWIIFNGVDLRYLENERSMESKRIIPASVMRNVEEIDVKSGDSKPYRFKLYTRDRIFIFAAQTKDDLNGWVKTLTQVVIQQMHQGQVDLDGGDMNQPDKEGYIRMDGTKGKVYLAIKGEKLCYYNTQNDFIVGTPVQDIDMKLTSVKEMGPRKLQLSTPQKHYMLIFDSVKECNAWKTALEKAIMDGLSDNQVIFEVYENEDNKICVDCGAPDPDWASINLGVVMCKQCAGIHRNMGVPMSKVRSLRMDHKDWTPYMLAIFSRVGNRRANNFWEFMAYDRDKITQKADSTTRQQYIFNKYKTKKFVKIHPLEGDQFALNEALCTAVQQPDVVATMELLFSGADIHAKSAVMENEGKSALELAKAAQEHVQVEFLFRNGAEAISRLSLHDVPPPVAGPASPVPYIYKGYLHKTGANNKEFQKRWCVLECGCLSYYTDDKSTSAKDTIEKSEMLSISVTTSVKFEYAFELSTTKTGGRLYTFATDSKDDFDSWMSFITKSLAFLSAVEHTDDVTSAGFVWLRDGSTSDWEHTWFQLKGRCLGVATKDSVSYEEVDLRKIISIKKREGPDLNGCPEAFDKGLMFVVDMPQSRALYIQGDLRHETEMWYTLIHSVITSNSMLIDEQQLTQDNVPVVVAKCIDFLSTHGLQSEGIYRLAGSHTRITELLEEFTKDARSVVLKQDDYTVNDVANTLKRFFRSLKDPLMTLDLYARWVETSGIQDHDSKLQWYKHLLSELPEVNYNTLKALIFHLVAVVENEAENKMGAINLGSLFGPALMTLDDTGIRGGFSQTQYEISCLVDMLTYYEWLFEVKIQEKEKERKIQEALEKMKIAGQSNQSQAGDLLIAIYLYNNRDDPIANVKVPAQMTCQQLLDQLLKGGKVPAGTDKDWGLFEVICSGELERPVHCCERVLDVILRWASWDDKSRKDNFLCLKENLVYKFIGYVVEPQSSLFSEMYYSEKGRRAFKKLYFEFNQSKLSMKKDTKAAMASAEWRVEDMTIYMGTEKDRKPPTRWSFTFLVDSEREVRDPSYFGRSLCCDTEEEMYKWIAGMIHAQHPEGLTDVSEEAMKHHRPVSAVFSPPGIGRNPAKKSFFKKISSQLRRN